jgi:hypothetical protein
MRATISGTTATPSPAPTRRQTTAYPGVETGTAGVAQGLEADRRCPFTAPAPGRPWAPGGTGVALTELGAALLLEPLPP